MRSFSFPPISLFSSPISLLQFTLTVTSSVPCWKMSTNKKIFWNAIQFSMFSAPLLPYCHRHQPPPKQQFTILRGKLLSCAHRIGHEKVKKMCRFDLFGGKMRRRRKISTLLCESYLFFPVSRRWLFCICSRTGDTHVYVHRDTHTASNVKALDLWQRYQISYLIRNLDAPTPQTFCLFLLEPDFVAKIKCYFSPSFVETICWCLDRQDKYKTYMEPLGRFPTGKILLHKTCSISARSFLKSLSI